MLVSQWFPLRALRFGLLLCSLATAYQSVLPQSSLSPSPLAAWAGPAGHSWSYCG